MTPIVTGLEVVIAPLLSVALAVNASCPPRGCLMTHCKVQRVGSAYCGSTVEKLTLATVPELCRRLLPDRDVSRREKAGVVYGGCNATVGGAFTATETVTIGEVVVSPNCRSLWPSNCGCRLQRC